MSADPKTALTGCLQPIDKEGLEGLIAKGKEDPTAIKVVKCKTVAEGRFRHLNYVRDLTLNLYVKDDTFMMRVFFDDNNMSYRGIITFDYCPVFIDRNGRILWTIS